MQPIAYSILTELLLSLPEQVNGLLPLAQNEGIGQWLFLVIFVLIWVFSIIAGAIKKQGDRRRQQERFSRGGVTQTEAATRPGTEDDAEEELPPWVHQLPEPVRRQMGIESPPRQQGRPAPPAGSRRTAEIQRPPQDAPRPRPSEVPRPEIFASPHRQPYAPRQHEPYQRREPTLARTSGVHAQKRPTPPRTVTSRAEPSAMPRPTGAAGTAAAARASDKLADAATPDIFASEIGRGDTPSSPAARESANRRSHRLRDALGDRDRLIDGVLIAEVLGPPIALRDPLAKQ